MRSEKDLLLVLPTPTTNTARFARYTLRGLLKKHQGEPLNPDEIKLVAALIEIMRVGRESPHQGWHQVWVTKSTLSTWFKLCAWSGINL